VDSRQIDGSSKQATGGPSSKVPLPLWVNRVALAMSASSPVQPPNIQRIPSPAGVAADGSEWNGPAALRPNVLAVALANKLARIAWTVLAQERGYEARVAAIESCDPRIRRATLDHRYLHLLARCGLCAKSVRVKVSGRLREKCRHESIEA
jgi:hypothetical protein